MGGLAGSFLLRWWRVGGGEVRFEVEHIQTGARTIATDLAGVCDWLHACCREIERTDHPAPTAPERRAAGTADASHITAYRSADGTTKEQAP